jgi:hypothetical protein
MSFAIGNVSFFEAHSEDSSEERTDVQPSDPGKISLTTVKSITEHFRLWQMNLLGPLNLQVGDTETCRLS